MSKRARYTDKIIFTDLRNLRGHNGAHGFVQGATFDTKNALAMGCYAQIATIGSGKVASMSLTHSDVENAGFREVEADLVDINFDTSITDRHARAFTYWGDKRYIRLLLASRTANSGLLVRYCYYKLVLHSMPSNKALE